MDSVPKSPELRSYASPFFKPVWNKNEKQKLGRAVKLSYDPHEKKSIIYNRKTAYSG